MKRSGSLLLVLVAMGLALAQPAGAAEYTVKNCHSGLVTGIEYWFPVQPTMIGAENNCPSELVFINRVTVEGQPTMEGDFAWFESSAVTNHVKSMSFEIEGGDTTGATEYFLTDCGGCEPVHEIIPDDDVGFRSLTFNDLDMYTVNVAARCVAETCPVVTPFRIRNFEFVAVDDEAPGISFPVDPHWGTQREWFNEDLLNSSVVIGDDPSGVSGANVFVDGYPTWGQPECVQPIFNAWTGLRPCPGVIETGGFPLAWDLSTGEHTISAQANDAVGNASTRQATFKYDAHPLPPVEGLELLTPHGGDNWTSDPAIQLGFDDYEQSAGSYLPEAFEGAPLDTYMTDLDPLSGQAEDPQEVNTPATEVVNWILPAEGRWRLWIWSLDEAGNESFRRSIDVGLDLDTPPAPQLTANSWISADQLAHGYEQVWVLDESPPENESGVCGFSFLANDEPNDIPSLEATYDATARTAEIPKNIGAGEHFAHIRSIGCNGNPSDTSSVSVNVDDAPPSVGMFSNVVGEWTGQSGTATISANDDASGVARVETSFDGENWQQHFSSIVKIEIPDGEHMLRYRAVDVATNVSDVHSAVFRVDAAAPTAKFASRIPTNPALLRAELRDEGSGTASAWIEFRMIGDSGWRRLGTAAAGPELGAGFSRQIDESVMLAGSYEFRLTASDFAKNKFVGTADNGGLITLDLPLRNATRLSAGIAEIKRSCRRGEKQTNCRGAERIITGSASAFRRIRYGDPVAIVGVLTDEFDAPLAARTVDIYAEQKFGVRQLAATVQTDANGEFSWRPGRVASTNFDVEFEGDAAYGEQEVALELQVRAAVSMKLSRSRVRAKQNLVFSGRVEGAARFAIGGAKTVTIQYLRGDRWTDTSDSPQTDTNGRFRTSISWPQIPRKTRIWFHARVEPDGNWPFVIGSSKRTSVLLIP